MDHDPTDGTGVPADGDELVPELLRLLPERDPTALAWFFDAYFPRVYGYLRRLVRDEQLAEDLCQETFFHAHRALATYDPERELRPWVFTIATNKVRDYWRSRRHRDAQQEESVERDGVVDQVPAGVHRPESDMAGRELAERVQSAVDELPEGMRVVVLLRVYEGLSFAAIGEVVGRNEVAVRKRYSRALESLRATLGPLYRLHAEQG